MNWRLFALGLVIAVISSASGGFVGHKITLATDAKNWEQVEPTIKEAILKSTNEITNEIRIDKIKKSDSLRIVMDPTNKQTMALSKNCGPDSVCVAVKHLTRKQKRRLGLN